VTIQWILFFVVYGGVSHTLQAWFGAAVPALIVLVASLSWRQLRW
jgi:hypothetical protein